MTKRRGSGERQVKDSENPKKTRGLVGGRKRKNWTLLLSIAREHNKRKAEA